jgi:L-ascorbate metabolism protein UlaG (beta-lactamase superfamily)
MRTWALVCALLLVLAMSAGAASEEFPTSEGVVKITPVRHASLTIQGGGMMIQVDPWGVSNYASAPAADLILITHQHGDHLDPEAIAKLRKPSTILAGPASVREKFGDAILLSNGDTKSFGKWKVEAIPAYNIKRMRPDGKPFHPRGEGNGYVLTFGGKRFYIAGDTEGTPEMRALKNIDAAFVCMNLPYTMTPEEAADAVRAFRPKVVYPYHSRNSDLTIFEKALAGTGVEVRIRNWY